MIKVRPIQLVRQGGLPFAVLSGLHPTQPPTSVEAWQKCLSENYEYLQHCSYDPILLQGISLSSHSLMERLPGLRERASTQFHQTSAQAARTVCQYLSRTAAKTSPFSALTTVGLVKHQMAQAPYATTRVIPSFQLLQLFREELQPWTFWVLNGSLLRTDTEYIWIARHPELGEQLHKMQHSDILEWLETTFLESEHPVNAYTCIQKLAEATDATEDNAKAFLLKLAEVGWMLPAWPVEQKTALWPAMLSRESWAPLPLLQLTQDKALEFPEESAEERAKVLRHLHGSWAAFAGHDRIPVPEKMLNEDVLVRPEIPARWQDALPEVIEQVEDCLQTILPYYRWPAREQVIQLLQGKGRLPLVKAYELCASSLLASSQPSPIVEELPISLDQSEAWRKLPWVALKEFFSSHPANHPGLDELGPSQGCFLQFWPNRINERFSAYVGATFAGYGKHMARYLSEYDETLAAEVMLENESMAQASGGRWVEMTDASLHNTEFRTPLMEGELLLPGAWRLYPPDLSVFPADLFAEVKDQTLLLTDSQGKRLFPFDQGLIAPPARSPFFKFLTLFGYWHPNISSFIEALEEYLLKPQLKEGIMVLPEMRWTEDLVLVRRAVYLHHSLLPVQEKGETHADFYSRIHLWKHQLGLSDHLFFTIAPKLPFYNNPSAENQKADDYKPHYLDLNSPVCVDLFGRMMKRVTGYCKLERMQPSPEQLASAHVQEWLVEWDRK